MRRFLDNIEVERTTPYAELSPAQRKVLLYGTTDADKKKLGFNIQNF